MWTIFAAWSVCELCWWKECVWPWLANQLLEFLVRGALSFFQSLSRAAVEQPRAAKSSQEQTEYLCFRIPQKSCHRMNPYMSLAAVNAFKQGGPLAFESIWWILKLRKMKMKLSGMCLGKSNAIAWISLTIQKTSVNLENHCWCRHGSVSRVCQCLLFWTVLFGRIHLCIYAIYGSSLSSCAQTNPQRGLR